MHKRKALNTIRKRRAARSRANIFGTAERPRLAVFRSNRSLAAQLIDDTKGHTLTAVSARELDPAARKKPKKEQAALTGELMAKKALEKKIARAVFDRRRYRYHGRVGAFVEGARKAGLKI